MTDREAMKMALEALIVSHPMANTYNSLDKHSEAMSALRQALAQPEQWVSLTDDEIETLAEYHGVDGLFETTRTDFARDVENILKGRNV